MPRYVDHQKRRREILDATNRVIAEDGLRNLSFRAVADRLGGSTTLVTHYYGSQEELLTALATSLVDSWAADLDALEAGSSDPRQRLAILLEWLLPLTEHGRIEETARLNLLAERNLRPEIRGMFDAWENRMRELLRTHLSDIVPPEDLDLRVATLRALTNGLTLSMIEHPELWSRDRVLEVLDRCMRDMKLAPRGKRAVARVGSAESPARNAA